MTMRQTLKDTTSEAVTETWAVLTHVLSYDDLLQHKPLTVHLTTPELVMGRAHDDDALHDSPSSLRLPSRWLSANHALIRNSALGYMLEDLGSLNGTYVNGSRVSHHVLRDGDLIEVGHCLLLFRLVHEALARPLVQKQTPVFLGPTETVCPELMALARDLRSIAPTTISVLILGETGAGKEIAAHMVHEASERKGQLRIVNCGALPDTLVEAELFGHKRGAFTGATDNRVGEIANADGGTLFLDEIANMSLSAQAKLLRVTQDGIVAPIGSGAQRKVDVRWVSATNVDLFKEPASFRVDLLNRLAAHVVRLPPLRKRREDLGILTAHVLREAGSSKASITPAAGRLLFNHPIYGNVRELALMLGTAARLAGNAPIDVKHLPERITNGNQASAAPEAAPVKVAPSPIMSPVKSGRKTALDKTAIEEALAANQGNVTQTAASLGVHPRQLYRWMDRLGIDRERFRG